MRISDWSSDVCSSDLLQSFAGIRLTVSCASSKQLTTTGPSWARAGEEAGMLAAMAPHSPTAVIPEARTTNSALQIIILRSRLFRPFLLGHCSAKRLRAKVETNSYLLTLRSFAWPCTEIGSTAVRERVGQQV